MKIIAPVSKISEVEYLISAGADEIYCGVSSHEWLKDHTDLASINRHPGRSANLRNFAELKKVIKSAHARNIPVLFTVNEFYSRNQYEPVLDCVKTAVDLGIDALIAVDINLILAIKKTIGNKIGLHIGTGGVNFNSEAILFYKELGAKRIVLDRHLNIEDFKAISSRTKNDIELEAMTLNQKCKNIDGLCTFQHGFLSTKYKHLAGLYNTKISKTILGLFSNSEFLNSYIFTKELGCCLNYKISEVACKNKRIAKTKDKNIKNFFNVGGFLNKCGACTIYDLDKMGIAFFKIIGRENLTTKKIQDVRFLNYCKGLLADRLDKKEYSKKVISFYKKIYNKRCSASNCYYN